MQVAICLEAKHARPSALCRRRRVVGDEVPPPRPARVWPTACGGSAPTWGMARSLVLSRHDQRGPARPTQPPASASGTEAFADLGPGSSAGGVGRSSIPGGIALGRG